MPTIHGINTTMLSGRLGFPVCIFIAASVMFPACRKIPPPAPLPEKSTPATKVVSEAKPSSPIFSNAVETHRASQEMALDGFQFDKSQLGWPFDIQSKSLKNYFGTLIREGFLPPEASAWPTNEWQLANLSDADPGETVFLQILHPDNSLLVLRKDGRWAVFQNNSGEADAFAKTPNREPAWLEK